MKTHIWCSITLFRKSHHLSDNVGNYGRDWGVTNDATIWRIRVACWIIKATCAYTHTHAPCYMHACIRTCTQTQIYDIYWFSTQHWCMNMSECYIIHTLTLLFNHGNWLWHHSQTKCYHCDGYVCHNHGNPGMTLLVMLAGCMSCYVTGNCDCCGVTWSLKGIT